jgi:CheY-like chemotaxis protein
LIVSAGSSEFRRVVLNLSTKSERILLVDAEPFIVKMVSQFLREIGYAVDACRDFQEAL